MTACHRIWICALCALCAQPALAFQSPGPEERLAAASALFDQKKYSEAAAGLEGFLKAFPTHARVGPAALALARCYVELKQYAKAVPAYDRAVQSKDAAVVAIARLGLGEAALLDRQYARAARALEVSVTEQLSFDQLSLAWYWLGQARLELGQFEPAGQAFQKILRDFPTAGFADSALFNAGYAAYRARDGVTAQRLLQDLARRYPRSPDRLQAGIILAQVDLDEKRFAEARRALESIERDPAFAGADTDLKRSLDEALVRALMELEQFEPAIERLRLVIGRLAPTDPQVSAAQLSLGHCLFRRKQYEPALAAYREASRGTRGEVAAEGHYWAANTLLALQKPAEAAAEFARVPARFPKHELAAKAHLRSATSLEAAGKPEASAAYQEVANRYAGRPEAAEAKKALGRWVDLATDPVQISQALRTAPAARRTSLQLRLARAHQDAGNYAQAEGVLQPIIASKSPVSERAEARYLLGRGLEARNKPAPAAAEFEAAVAAVPVAAWTADARSRLAWLYLDLKQPARSEAHARKVLTGETASESAASARLALLQALLDQKKWEPALEAARAITMGSPTPAAAEAAAFAEAWILGSTGRGDEAVTRWRDFLVAYPKSTRAAEAAMRLGETHFQAERFEPARDAFLASLATARGGVAAEARFKLGSTLYNLKEYAAAATEWGRVSTDAAAGPLAPEALYWAGLAHEKAGVKTEAIRVFEQLVARHPKHTRVAAAKVRLAVLKAGG